MSKISHQSKSLVDHKHALPLYQQVKNVLVQRIQNKNWTPGELIPTEVELIQEFGVSRTTIRQAIMSLVQDELLEKRQGIGTIVKSQKLVGKLGRLAGFAEEAVVKGYQIDSKLLRTEIHDNLYFEKKILQLNEDDKVLVIERIRYANYEPIAYERTCWPIKIGNVFLGYDLNRAKYYQILEDEGIFLKKAHETIIAVNATIYEAGLLGVSGGEALLEMTRIAFGIDDQPIEYTRTKYRSDRYHYDIDLHR